MKRRVHLKSQPIYVKKLIDTLGMEKAAKELGITPWAVKRHLNNNETSPAIEMAAQYLYEKKTNAPDGTVAVVSGDAILMQTIQKIVQFGNGNYTIIN